MDSEEKVQENEVIEDENIDILLFENSPDNNRD